MSRMCVRGMLAGPLSKEGGLEERDLEVRLFLVGVGEGLFVLCDSSAVGGESGC